MSECVVRMEMPENCCECQLRQEGYEMGEEFCPFTGVECLSIGRQNNCPIICQLPEGQGRLGDLDALKEWFIDQIDYYKRFDGPNCSIMVSAYEAVCRVINDATTIVPAEVERSET